MAFGVHETQLALRVSISMVGCLAIPRQSFSVALEHALVMFVNEAQVELFLGMSLVSSNFQNPNNLVNRAGLGGRQPAP